MPGEGLGREHSGVEIARVLLWREHLFAACAVFFDEHDLLLAPTAPAMSRRVDELGPATIGGWPAPTSNGCSAPHRARRFGRHRLLEG